MSGNSTSVSTEVQEPDGQGARPDSADLSNTLYHCPMQHENEEGQENKQGDGSGNDNSQEEDEDEDADFNPFLKDTNSAEASSSLSSEVEDLGTDIAESSGKPPVALDKNSGEKDKDGTKDCRTGGNVEHGEEIVMQTTVSSGEVCRTKEKESVEQTQSENGSLCDKENDSTILTDVSNATDSRKPMTDMDTEGAICMRTRARYSLASFSLDELETFLQETDDEDDLQNVDDEEEYRKFLAAVLRGDDSQNLEESTNADDEDEENDADFELELEEALESEPEEIEERRMTRRNRRQKASLERSKRLTGQSNRPLRPLVPFASIGPFSTFDGKNLTPNIAPSYMPPANSGFTPDQIGQLHCLIHEHVQLLIQVFSLCVLEPAKSHIAAEVKELVVDMLQKRDQVLSWRTVPYPSFCFFPPYVHPSVSSVELQKTLPPKGSDKNVQRVFPPGGNRELHSDIISLSNERHKNVPDGQAGSSQTLECTSWVPYICGPVLSIADVAPLRLVENYIEDVSSAVRAYERYQIEIGFETHCQKEPLFALHNSPCSADSDGQGEAENPPLDSNVMLSSSSSNQMPKKTMAATLLEKAKSQSVALVPKEIAKLAQRFWPLFNAALYPHKPPPAPLANRVLFTDAEDELLALGLMEYNTDWKAIQQRFLPCKSRHQIFVRQKNRASSKAPENPIKAVRRMKNSPLTSEEIARIEVGLKRFKLDWISIWRCFVPYRDPSLLPRQWRIASGTQKSYKSDATKKAKRRLYELRRKNSKPSPSTWHSSSEKEGDSTDNAVEETNSGDNRMDKEDEAYVHEAFLADWRPDNTTTINLPNLLPSQEASQAREQNDNSGSGFFQPQMSSESPASLRPSISQVVLRPYRARKPNSARLVKLAPDLPPVNLPPSVRIMSQSAFKSSTVLASSINSGNASRIPGIAVDNRTLSRSTMNSGIGSSVKSGPNGNNSVKITASSQHPNLSEVTIDKSAAERDDSDLQMHPLLFQAPQDGRLPYYPVSCNTRSSSSFTFFSGKQPQLNLGLFHNPRHIRDAVNFLSKSSKPPEINAPPPSSSYGVDFHPLLQRTDDVDVGPTSARPAARRPNTESKTQKVASVSGRSNELDLDIHLSFTSKNQESRDMALLQGSGRLLSASNSGAIEPERAKYSSKKRDSAPDRISRKVSENVCDESLPEIVMEQEELSDSEEEFGENVEFECEEMADSEGDSTSDSEQFVNIPDEEVQLDDIDADIDEGRVLNTTSNDGGNTSSRPLNLNSCPPVSPHSNLKNAVAGYEFGPFGTTGTFSPNNLPASSKKSSSRHTSLARHPRKRVCRSNSNSSVGGSGKGNSNPNIDMSVEKSKNVVTDEFY